MLAGRVCLAFSRQCSNQNIPDCIVEKLYRREVYPIKYGVDREKLFTYHYNSLHGLPIDNATKQDSNHTNEDDIESNLLKNEIKKAHDIAYFDTSNSNVYEYLSEKLYFLKSNWRGLTEQEKTIVSNLGFPNLNFPVKISPFENIQVNTTSFPLSSVPRMLEYDVSPVELADMNGPLKRILREELPKLADENFKKLLCKGFLTNNTRLSLLNYSHYHYLRKQLEFLVINEKEKNNSTTLKDSFLQFYHNYQNNKHRDVATYIKNYVLNDPVRKKYYLQARQTIMKQIPHWSEWKKVDWEALQYSNVQKSQLKALRRLYRSLLVGDLILFDWKLFAHKFILDFYELMKNHYHIICDGYLIETNENIDPTKFFIDKYTNQCNLRLSENCTLDIDFSKSNDDDSPLLLINEKTIDELFSLLFTKLCASLYYIYSKCKKIFHIKVVTLTDVVFWAIGEIALAYGKVGKTNNIPKDNTINFAKEYINKLESGIILNNNNIIPCEYLYLNKFYAKQCINYDIDIIETFHSNTSSYKSSIDDIAINARIKFVHDNQLMRSYIGLFFLEHQLYTYIERKAISYFNKFYNKYNYSRKIHLAIQKDLYKCNGYENWKKILQFHS